MKHAMLCLALAVAVAASAEDAPPPTGAVNRMQIVLERKDGSKWKAVDPGLVFSGNDHVRFKYRANFPGYLYVLNQSTSGHYTQLFPNQQTGMVNRLEQDREYLVPATEGSFRVTGPAGFDVVYWMVSPVELSGSAAADLTKLPPPAPANVEPQDNATLLPRCNEGLFRARGECVDPMAGTKQVGPNQVVPQNLQSMSTPPSRELVFIREKESTVVSSPNPIQGPVIYQFRIAHK